MVLAFLMIIIEIKEFSLMRNKFLRISDENGSKRPDIEYTNKYYLGFSLIYDKVSIIYG